MSKDSDERFTPEDVLDMVREFAPIVLDPCTSKTNPTRADLFFTSIDDGLGKAWSSELSDKALREGVVFVNPPYSRGQLIKWARKVYDESCFGLEILALVPADTSTSATQHMLQTANVVGFWRKRICFAGEQGAKFANALFYWGERQGRFQRVFRDHALVVVLR